MDSIVLLQEWFTNQCNGAWEHVYGITITTLDNPGWHVEINLIDTELEEKPFDKIQFENSTNDWIYCVVEDGVFKGNGDSNKLLAIVEIFNKWKNLYDS